MTDENKTEYTPPAFAIEEDEPETGPRKLPPMADFYSKSVNIIWGDCLLLQGAVAKLVAQMDPEEGSVPPVDEFYGETEEDDNPESDTTTAMALADIEETARAVQAWSKKVVERSAALRSAIHNRPKPM